MRKLRRFAGIAAWFSLAAILVLFNATAGDESLQDFSEAAAGSPDRTPVIRLAGDGQILLVSIFYYAFFLTKSFLHI